MPPGRVKWPMTASTATNGFRLTHDAVNPSNARRVYLGDMSEISTHAALGPGSVTGMGWEGDTTRRDPAVDMDQAFADLVMHHQDRALRLALRLLSGDRAAAEDVVQEAYLRAHRARSKFRGDAKLTTWFDRIVVREAYRHHRRPWKRWLAGEDPQDHVAPEPVPTSDPFLQSRVCAALDRLTLHQRTVFVLMHLEGHTATEVAVIMARSIGTVKSHLHRALKALRADLADVATQAQEKPPGDEHDAP